jgi:hypothetical protein
LKSVGDWFMGNSIEENERGRNYWGEYYKETCDNE